MPRPGGPMNIEREPVMKENLADAAYGTARRALPPLRIVVELYDMALTAVAHARAERSKGHIQAEFQALLSATRTLQGLDACLDMDDGRAAPIARVLRGYYRHILTQLHAAKRSEAEAAVARYASVYRQLLAMRETWAELAGVPSLRHPARQALPSSK